jgi:hypothetical protein
MSTNYRIFNAKEVVASGATATGSLDRAWGIMVNSTVCSGSLYLEGLTGTAKTVLKLEYLPKNIQIPCYPAYITVYGNYTSISGSYPEYITASNGQRIPQNPPVSGMYSVQVTTGSVYLLA